MAKFTKLTLTAAVTAIAIAAPALAQTESTAPRLKPYYGSIDPFYGNIDPFYGNIDPFWGSIDPFYGNIDPFYGNIDPFWGSIDPFSATISTTGYDYSTFWGSYDPLKQNSIVGVSGTVPAYANVGAYWRSIGPTWHASITKWSALGTYTANPSGYLELQKTLNSFVSQSEATWGSAVTARTGLSFSDGFAKTIFSKYGVDLSNPATFQGLSDATRARLFLDWYDGLMAYSGADHLDYWMGTVKWSPLITREQGSGSGTVIGLLDSTVVNNPDIANNLIYTGGYTNPLYGHGTAVASLLVSDHNGSGLMGIAPNASLAAYNPFDSTNTASWLDVAAGVTALKLRGASVINMSLGVPGSALDPSVATLFNNPSVATSLSKTVFVIAAGNDGLSQSGVVNWNFVNDPSLIVVGSVDPMGNISNFSNRPGSACLSATILCSEANRLMNRFIVAPGEALLVSDGQGGLARRSGTSFAAPLVTGAVALLHDRWPWLANFPRETTEIIFKSAKDLGAAGVDPVYGWGLLDVQASQSPLNFNNAVYYHYKNGIFEKAKTISSIRTAGVKSSWEAEGTSFAIFETIGATKRDFVVPLSSRLIGQKTSAGGTLEYYQSYLTSRFIDWVRTGSFTGFSSTGSVEVPNGEGWSVTMTGTPTENYLNRGLGISGGHSAITVSNDKGGFALTGGYGQGALAFNGQSGFGLISDHNSSDGGVNPLLGFASGGAFAAAEFRVAPNLSIATGFTQQRLKHSNLPGLEPSDREALRGLKPYRAGAVNLAVTYDLAKDASVTASYTRLNENEGLLGVQSAEASDLANGSASDALTLMAQAKLGRGFQLSASATAANTRTGNADQAFNTAGGGVMSSSFALALAKTGVVGKHDHVRFSLAQPLHIERGVLEFTSVAVIDRQTGELGLVTQEFEIGGEKRRLTGEAIYATPVLSGQGELSVFGRAELQEGGDTNDADLIAGARFRIGF